MDCIKLSLITVARSRIMAVTAMSRIVSPHSTAKTLHYDDRGAKAMVKQSRGTVDLIEIYHKLLRLYPQTLDLVNIFDANFIKLTMNPLLSA